MVGASLAIEHEAQPIQSLNDIVGSNYKIEIQIGGSIQDYFLSAKEGSPQHQIVEANKLIAEQAEAGGVFKRMVNGDLPDGTFYFGNYQADQYSLEWSCDVASVNFDYYKMSNGMVFQKDWPFTSIFNNQLLKLREEGYLGALQRRYSQVYRNRCYGKSIKPTTLSDTISLFVLMSIGLFSSALVFLFEKWHSII